MTTHRPHKPYNSPRTISLTPQGIAYGHWLDARRKLVERIACKRGWAILKNTKAVS